MIMISNGYRMKLGYIDTMNAGALEVQLTTCIELEGLIRDFLGPGQLIPYIPGPGLFSIGATLG